MCDELCKEYGDIVSTYMKVPVKKTVQCASVDKYMAARIRETAERLLPHWHKMDSCMDRRVYGAYSTMKHFQQMKIVDVIGNILVHDPEEINRRVNEYLNA